MSIEILENVPLAPLTTMRTGGSARYFVSVRSVDELREAIAWVKNKNLPIFVLGGGSNLLVSDSGFSGLVIKVEIKGISYENVHHGVRALAGSGEVWDEFVRDAVLRDLWGVENLSLIPGTVGGAAVQNIGAYGVEAKEVILEVEMFDTESGVIKIISGHKCKFGYRDSIFKRNKNLIVTRVVFNLMYRGAPHTEYEDVKKYFSDKGILHPTLQQIRDAVVAIRTEKMPGSHIGTAGSFFKNPVVDAQAYEGLKAKLPEIKAHLQGDGSAKISAGWLLDKVGGFRGFRKGNAGVHEKQALILVNHGNASTSEIQSLAQEIKKTILEKTGVLLEEEVVFVSE